MPLSSLFVAASPQALDFLAKLLTFDPRKRMTAAEVRDITFLESKLISFFLSHFSIHSFILLQLRLILVNYPNLLLLYNQELYHLMKVERKEKVKKMVMVLPKWLGN